MSAASTTPLPTQRDALLARLRSEGPWDVAIIGGGATGLGIALDAALRGFRVVLLEAVDFASGTSSRSTKLVHGGVRYLAQGHVGLVREALRERSRILHNAPHLARALPFVMPAYRWWEAPFYGIGLELYDLMAGRAGLGATAWLSRSQVRRALPNVRAQGLRGGVQYWDGQFDDARLALAIARTAALHGALLLNHAPVDELMHEGGRLAGVVVRDEETGNRHQVHARCVINATGVWVDALRARSADAAGLVPRPLVAPSQGVHLVVDADFMPGEHALLVPATQDGRVLFAVPWLGKLVLGTTDTPRQDLPREPSPLPEEVDFILREAARYLERAPTWADVRSCWVGLRPLVSPPSDRGTDTRSISREHYIETAADGLVTVTGGKWTTYRAMAEDVLQHCMAGKLLPRREAGATRDCRLVGAEDAAAGPAHGADLSGARGLHAYGSEASWVAALPGHDRLLGPDLSEAMVRFAARHEYARTVEDVLARRQRLLFTDAAEAARAAPEVARVLEQETGCPPRLEPFLALAAQYLRPPGVQSA